MIILQEIQDTGDDHILLSCGNAVKLCREWCCVRPVRSCTGYELLASLLLFYLFSAWFWVSGVSLALSPHETAAEPYV